MCCSTSAPPASPVRLAIETRDRSRPATIEWIDDLVGKYRDLPIDKVIAVSRSGFSISAAEKAVANNIEMRNLREALDADWPTELLKFGVARLEAELRVKRIHISTEPAWTANDLPTTVLMPGKEVSRDEFMIVATKAMHAEIGPYMAKQLGRTFKTLGDLDQELDLSFATEAPDSTFVDGRGRQFRFVGMITECRVKLSYQVLPVRRELFGDVGVTSADDESPTSGAITTMLVQEPGNPPRPPVMFKRKPQT